MHVLNIVGNKVRLRQEVEETNRKENAPKSLIYELRRELSPEIGRMILLEPVHNPGMEGLNTSHALISVEAEYDFFAQLVDVRSSLCFDFNNQRNLPVDVVENLPEDRYMFFGVKELELQKFAKICLLHTPQCVGRAHQIGIMKAYDLAVIGHSHIKFDPVSLRDRFLIGCHGVLRCFGLIIMQSPVCYVLFGKDCHPVLARVVWPHSQNAQHSQGDNDDCDD